MTSAGLTPEGKETISAVAEEMAARGLLTGAELGKISPEDFARQVERIRVYARVAP